MITGFAMQQQTPAYCSRIRTKTPIIGVWDDHDYGVNDGDSEYELKNVAQKHFLDFLDIPSEKTLVNEASQKPSSSSSSGAGAAAASSALHAAWLHRRRQEGVYNSHIFGPPGQRVKVILLDNRYFQEHKGGDILGEQQWQWLENELYTAAAPYGSVEYEAGGAELVIVSSGIQIVTWYGYSID